MNGNTQNSGPGYIADSILSHAAKAGKYAVCATAISMLALTSARADYPERPITFIAPASPGGPTDTGVRAWTPFLEKCLGNGASVVVVNKPGAGHMIGLTELSNSKPDGYTLGTVLTPNMPVTSLKAGYTADSFDYLNTMYGSAALIVVRKDSKYQTLQELIDEAKNSGKPLKIGLASLAGDDHLLGIQLAQAAGVEITFVPLGDSAPTRSAVLGGHIDVVFLAYSDVLSFANELKPLAITGDERAAAFPDVPTYKELGYDIIGGATQTTGAPAGLPVDIRKKLTDCFDRIAADPEFQDVAKKRSLLFNPMNSEETEKHVRQSYDTIMKLWKEHPWE